MKHYETFLEKDENDQIKLKVFDPNWSPFIQQRYHKLNLLKKQVQENIIIKNWNDANDEQHQFCDQIMHKKGSKQFMIVWLFQRKANLKLIEIAWLIDVSIRWVAKVYAKLKLNHFFSEIKRQGLYYKRKLNLGFNNALIKLNQAFINFANKISQKLRNNLFAKYYLKMKEKQLLEAELKAETKMQKFSNTKQDIVFEFIE